MFLLVAAWFGAPAIQSSRGHADGAAWVTLWMIPTGLIGVFLCGLNLWLRTTPLLVVAGVVYLIHCAIALGFHPR